MIRRLLVVGAAFAAACSHAPSTRNAAPAPAAPAAPALKSGLDLTAMDASVRPQDDYYRYVNGTWLKNTPIPADKPYWAPFAKLRDDTDAQVRDIIEASSKQQNAPGSEEQKVGDLYNSFMDEPRLEALGLAPLQAEFDRIDALKSRAELPALMAHYTLIGIGSPFDSGVDVDAKNSSRYIVYSGQGGLGLPDRDYYLSDEQRFKDLRAAYVKHVEQMFTLAGFKGAAKSAQAIMAFETQLAKKQWSKVDARDVSKIYNFYELAKLDALTPGFAWKDYLATADFTKSPGFVVMQPDYFKAATGIMAKTPLPTLKTYFRWQVLHAYAAFLSKPYVDENFAFYGTTLAGIPQNRPRWQRGSQLVQGSLGEAVGKIYVKKYFPPEAKARMEVLVGNLVKAYEQSIRSLDWMSEETRQKALVKLSKFTPHIGYPDKWRDYSPLAVASNDLVGNVMRARAYESAYDTHKLGQPIDKEEWPYPPQTVNASYNPLKNAIYFPAGYLQPPQFDMAADDAMNYGAIGSTIGHEIGHGFDDQGSKFDGDGNLQSWWTDEDRRKFEERTHALIEQYNAYCPLKDACLNGALTIGENIGDLGGLSIAYKAWKIALAGKESPVIDGLTGDQRFFMGFAQNERMLLRDEFLVQMIKTNPHAPGEFRCKGVLVNVPEFYSTYGVTAKDGMYLPPEKRVKIW